MADGTGASADVPGRDRPEGAGLRRQIAPALVAGAVGLGAGFLVLSVAGTALAVATAVVTTVAGFAFLLSNRADLPARAADGQPAAGPAPTEGQLADARADAVAGVVRRLPVPAVLTDARRQILAVSAPAETLLRRRAEGRPLPDLIRHPELLSAVQATIAQGVEQEVSFQESVPEPRMLHALIAPAPALGPAGADSEPATAEAQTEPGGALILLDDLTAQTRAEQMRVDFIANVSHELRTPLASLAGFLETLRGPAAGDPVAQERFLAIMEEQTARMTRLVETLMSLSRIEQGERERPRGRVNVNRTVAHVADALRVVADRLGSRIEIIADLDPAEIVGDEDQVAQVVRNLIENAIKYGRAESTVEVRIAALPDEATAGSDPQENGAAPTGETPVGEKEPEGSRQADEEDEETASGPAREGISGPAPEAAPMPRARSIAIAITDVGEGIPEEHLPRLTERFYRVDVARARDSLPSDAAGTASQADSGGGGLGLAIVKHIVARHDGRLEISSRIGVGSTFTVVFPEAPSRATETPAPTAEIR